MAIIRRSHKIFLPRYTGGAEPKSGVLQYPQGREQDFSQGCQDGNAEGRERGEVLHEGAATPTHQLGGLGSAVSSPAGLGVEPRPPADFPLFQHPGWPLLTL